MNKKYFPFLALLAAVLLFVWVKKNQRGHTVPVKPITVEPMAPPVTIADPQGFDRATAHLVFSKHAKCRMECRHIDEAEIKEILHSGIINTGKIEQSDKGISYPLEGVTHDNQHVRIVFAPHKDEMVVVTVIDLDKEWQCDCN